jgi:glyoxylase-like metal-dependent hydrolase (beta-lactamase superfamily II)
VLLVPWSKACFRITPDRDYAKTSAGGFSKEFAGVFFCSIISAQRRERRGRNPMAAPDFIGKFTANNPGLMTLQGTNQYIVGKESGLVIDVALSADSNMDGIIEQAEAMGVKKITKILLTHIHSDHTGGALALRKRCGAKLGIHRSRKGYLGGEDFQYDDNDRIDFGGGELHVLHTPGHESGHCCFYENGDKVLFSGDNILGYGTAVIHPPDGNMSDYMQTLERLLGFEMSLILPGHGPLIGKPEAKVREYIKHRLEREQQIIAALRAITAIPSARLLKRSTSMLRRRSSGSPSFPSKRIWKSSNARQGQKRSQPLPLAWRSLSGLAANLNAESPVLPSTAPRSRRAGSLSDKINRCIVFAHARETDPIAVSSSLRFCQRMRWRFRDGLKGTLKSRALRRRYYA